MSLQKHPDVASVMNPEMIQHYHAHVYYDPASSRDRAARLRERMAAAFPGATLGRWHDTPVGPHTQSMYQIAFPPPLLASFLPWLMLNRDGLSILLHPGTGDAYEYLMRIRRLSAPHGPTWPLSGVFSLRSYRRVCRRVGSHRVEARRNRLLRCLRGTTPRARYLLE